MEEIKTKLKNLDEIDVTNYHITSDDELREAGLPDSVSLRPYQLDGVNWLIGRFYRKHGAILGDEMGLGKTCQMITLLGALKSRRVSKLPALVVCPRSVLENWEEECKRFSTKLKVMVYIGDKEARQSIGQTFKDSLKSKNSSVDALITTYEMCLKDSSFLGSLAWEVLVVDEAHRLKNQESLLYRTLFQWDIHWSVFLTGTPVQNNLLELYALLSFVCHSIFKPRYQDKFVQRYSSDNNNDMSELHAILKPFILRRVKSDVLEDLPQRSEVILYHGLSTLQKKLYKAILTKDINAFNTSMYGPQPRLMNTLMQLRKCVSHPYLFDGVEPEPFMLGEHLVEASGKLILIDKLLSYLQANGHKVLLFSQMTHMLDILQDYLGFRGYTYERLDGSVRGEERFLAVRSFNENDETFVFLLSTKAGGQGINLTSADTVIFVDSDFNPQNDLQAAARAHRIGQTRPVKIIRLIGRSSVEEIILNRAEAKLKLTNDVIEGGQFSLGIQQDDKFKLQDILKFGVEKLFSDDDGTDDDDVDIVAILGPTTGSQWQLDETKSQSQEASTSSHNDDDDEEVVPQTMYMFEGTDYSKEPSTADQEVFDKLLAAAEDVKEQKMSEGRVLRATASMQLMGPLPEALKKMKKPLTAEQLEERRIKMKAAKEKRQEEEEAYLLKKAEHKKERKQRMWEKAGYTSCNIDLDSDGEEQDDDEEESLSIKYISGDVTLPSDSGTRDIMIIHCADDSGSWGRGGVFTAISKRCDYPEEQYELAGKMKDLSLGDAHLISLDNKDSDKESKDWLAIIIAQHRDSRNNLSGIKLSALDQGLQRVYKAAHSKQASVHLPRIGHDTPGFNWYGTERLIRKHLASKGIPTYIYYYPRKRHFKRKNSNDGDKPKKLHKPSDAGPSTSGLRRSSDLAAIFQKVSVYLHNLSDDDIKKYKRVIIAYDGEVTKRLETSTTHIVSQDTDENKENLQEMMIDHGFDLPVVTPNWLEESVAKGHCLNYEDYVIIV